MPLCFAHRATQLLQHFDVPEVHHVRALGVHDLAGGNPGKRVTPGGGQETGGTGERVRCAAYFISRQVSQV